jgi:hypothetical protein
MVVARKTGQNGRCPDPTKMPALTSTAVEGTNNPIMRSASPKAMRNTIIIAQPGFWAK